MRRLFVALFGVSLCIACSDDLDPPSRITELRLLAVQADHPYAQPGENVVLDALAVDPRARPLRWAWGTCVDAQSSIALDCLRALDFTTMTIGDDLSHHELTMPTTQNDYVGVAVVVCPGDIRAGDTNGIPLACVDETGRQLDVSEFEVGLKHIANRPSDLNHNPSIDGVTWDGAPWLEDEVQHDECVRMRDGECVEHGKHAIAVSAPNAVEGAQGDVNERAIVSFFATAGDFDDEVRFYDDAATKWRARKQDAAPQLVTMWFVLRDDRGGVSWTSRRVQID